MSIFQTLHNKKGTIGFLNSNCIWLISFLLAFMKLEIWSFWPDFDLTSTIEAVAHDPIEAITEFFGQILSGNMCHMTYLWLKFFVTFVAYLWPSSALSTGSVLQWYLMQYVVESSLAKCDSIPSYLTVVSHQSMNMFHMLCSVLLDISMQFGDQ